MGRPLVIMVGPMKSLVGGIAIFVVLYVTAIVVTKDIFGREGVHFGVFVFLSGICMLSVNLWIQRWFRRIADEKQPTPEERKEAVEKMLDEAGYPRDAPVDTGPATASAPQKLPNAELPKDDDGVEEFITSGARKAMEQEAKQSQKIKSNPANSKKSAAKPAAKP